MTLVEEDIFKEGQMPLVDEELEEDEDEDEDEEDEEEEDLDALEKDNEPEQEDEGDDDEDDDQEQDENDNDNENENENENEKENENDNEDEEEDEEMQDGSSTATKVQTLSENELKSEMFYRNLLIKAKVAESYDVNPFVAIPYASPVHSIALSKSCKWLFTGGEDGYIRKYDFFASIDGEVQLTAAQKHSLVDSISNGGALLAYWENEIPIKKSTLNNSEIYDPKLSPVYSLAVEDNCLWILSGLSNGGINLNSIRHNEGSIVHHFKKHTDTVSVLQLNPQQDKFISGSWDKLIYQWDLNTGCDVRCFGESTGQITSLQYRPSGGIGIDQVQQNINKTLTTEDDDLDSLFGDEDEDRTTQSYTTSTTKPDNQNISQGVDSNIFMSSAIDGSINIWDVRSSKKVLRFKAPKGTPPWCMSACWSYDGNSVFAGRRNGTVEEFSLKMPFNSHGDPKVSKTLKFPQLSGAVTVVKALPNNNHLVCGCYDNIRIYDLRLYEEAQKKTPFLIIPGHHGGVVSDIQFDPTYRYMISSSGNRGFQGTSTESVLFYEVGST